MDEALTELCHRDRADVADWWMASGVGVGYRALFIRRAIDTGWAYVDTAYRNPEAQFERLTAWILDSSNTGRRSPSRLVPRGSP